MKKFSTILIWYKFQKFSSETILIKSLILKTWPFIFKRTSIDLSQLFLAKINKLKQYEILLINKQ